MFNFDDDLGPDPCPVPGAAVTDAVDVFMIMGGLPVELLTDYY